VRNLRSRMAFPLRITFSVVLRLAGGIGSRMPDAQAEERFRNMKAQQEPHRTESTKCSLSRRQHRLPPVVAASQKVSGAEIEGQLSADELERLDTIRPRRLYAQALDSVGETRCRSTPSASYRTCLCFGW
jgi:hypothetical protein